MKFWWQYIHSPGSSVSKADKEHPALELNPSAFFDYYTKWFPEYYTHTTRISKISLSAVNTEERLQKNYSDLEQADIKRQEDDRKRKEFLNSPEGKRQVAKEQQEEKLKQQQFIKEFPYYAVITCGGTFQVHGCFSGRVNTELELRNGNDYKMYTLIDIMRIPNNKNGITFNLRNSFDIKMQNADDSLVLNLKVYNAATNAIIFEKSATKFGVIRLSN